MGRIYRIKCAHPGCCVRVRPPKRWCSKHGTPRRRDSRKSASKRGYDHRWRRIAQVYLVNNPICQCPGTAFCNHEPGQCQQAAVHVDHVARLENGKGDSSEKNLNGKCHSCHSKKTIESDGGFGREKS